MSAIALSPELLSVKTPGSEGMGDEKKLKKACQEFEAYFMGEVFKGMRKTIPEGGLINKGQGEKIYRDFADREVASKFSEGRGIGLSELMYLQLKENLFKQKNID